MDVDLWLPVCVKQLLYAPSTLASTQLGPLVRSNSGCCAFLTRNVATGVDLLLDNVNSSLEILDLTECDGLPSSKATFIDLSQDSFSVQLQLSNPWERFVRFVYFASMVVHGDVIYAPALRCICEKIIKGKTAVMTVPYSALGGSDLCAETRPYSDHVACMLSVHCGECRRGGV